MKYSKIFVQNDEAVNKALRYLLEVAKTSTSLHFE
jgi:hypothetical protein